MDIVLKDVDPNLDLLIRHLRQARASVKGIGPKTTLQRLIDDLEAQRPLQVGDRVLTPLHGEGEVRALEDGQAWVRVQKGAHVTYSVDDLERA